MVVITVVIDTFLVFLRSFTTHYDEIVHEFKWKYGNCKVLKCNKEIFLQEQQL